MRFQNNVSSDVKGSVKASNYINTKVAIITDANIIWNE